MPLVTAIQIVTHGLILALGFHLCINNSIMGTKKIIALILPVFFLFIASTCNKGSINPNIPNVVINITIDPNLLGEEMRIISVNGQLAHLQIMDTIFVTIPTTNFKNQDMDFA